MENGPTGDKSKLVSTLLTRGKEQKSKERGRSFGWAEGGEGVVCARSGLLVDVSVHVGGPAREQVWT